VAAADTGRAKKIKNKKQIDIIRLKRTDRLFFPVSKQHGDNKIL
jgi:hypothetical protein